MTAAPTSEVLSVAEAFRSLGIGVQVAHQVVILEVGGESVTIRAGEPEAGVRPQIVVRDRVSPGERHRLGSEGIGWLDLNGHLWFRSAAVVVDADVPRRSKKRPQRSASVFAGDVVAGVTVLALTAWPEPLEGVRPTARLIGATPGGVSLALKRLMSAGLMTNDHRATSDLFWAAAAEWRPEWVDLPIGSFPREIPAVAVGVRAAARDGAPVVVTAEAPVEILVRSQADLTYAQMVAAHGSRNLSFEDTMSGRGVPDQTVGRVAVAPSPVVVELANTGTVWLGGTPADAAEAVVALALATDPARGAETVRAWEGDHVW